MNWGPKRSSDSFKATQPAQDLDAGHLPSNPVFLPRDQHCLVPGVVGYKEAQNFLCAVQQVTSESWGTDRLHGWGVSTGVGLTQLQSKHQTKFPIPDPHSPHHQTPHPLTTASDPSSPSVSELDKSNACQLS